jgi:CubicO group peptidase (beta-lactamase class C family)
LADLQQVAITQINATVDPEFLPVADAFAATFAAQSKLGAADAVYVGGRAAVDLVVGVADKATGMVGRPVRCAYVR